MKYILVDQHFMSNMPIASPERAWQSGKLGPWIIQVKRSDLIDYSIPFTGMSDMLSLKRMMSMIHMTSMSHLPGMSRTQIINRTLIQSLSDYNGILKEP